MKHNKTKMVKFDGCMGDSCHGYFMLGFKAQSFNQQKGNTDCMCRDLSGPFNPSSAKPQTEGAQDRAQLHTNLKGCSQKGQTKDVNLMFPV